MASQHSTARKRPADPPAGYLEWSRDPAVGLFVVMPLWLVYVALRLAFVPDEINGAEYVVVEVLDRIGPVLRTMVHVAIAAAVLGAAWSIHRREIPWLRVGMVIVLEGSVYGLMLGPLAAELTRHSLPVLACRLETTRLVADLVGALGAGIFEELLFRLVILSAFVWMFFRACDAFAVPRWVGGVVAILASSVLFSLFHYFGDDRALEQSVFLFRTMAGVLLGALLVARGIGVCIYTHAMYDVIFYLHRT